MEKAVWDVVPPAHAVRTVPGAGASKCRCMTDSHVLRDTGKAPHVILGPVVWQPAPAGKRIISDENNSKRNQFALCLPTDTASSTALAAYRARALRVYHRGK